MKPLPTAIAMTLLGLFGIHLHAAPLAIGAAAPEITAPDENGQPVKLGDLCAKGITLVYFYPKASTPGCTAQACSLRDSIVDLKKIGVNVIGVSHDTPAAQKAFKEKYQLPFTLIADSEGKVIAAFGVPTLPFGMAKRQSFLIRDGRVVWYSPNAQTATHAREVEDAVAALK
ncbi:MAG: peroxiredoxin [Terrimicrobiaceae bacterium]|nr:peroxiredoxin [Terrimicrobiaceae bacterium]